MRRKRLLAPETEKHGKEGIKMFKKAVV